MRSVGIICECNPFHGGHEYLIRQARSAGADAVICVMSGYFVQRGEAAILDAHTRARALLVGGADAVFELPFPYSAASAEAFALAGVRMLSRLGVDELRFGSECGDLGLLTRAAAVCDSEEFRTRYAESAESNSGTAKAYFDLLSELLGEDVACLSNDILGIAYLRAIAEVGASMRPVTVRREGAAYLETVLTDGGYPSATALRARWREEGKASVLSYLPAATRTVLEGAETVADLRYAERAILSHLRLTSPERLERIAALSGGLGARMHSAALEATTLEELVALTATKKYTVSRIRRGILFALTEMMPEDLKAEPAYARLLAANATGCEFLAACRKRDGGIPVVTRKTDLPATEAAQRQLAIGTRAFALYTLCTERPRSVSEEWQARAYITKDSHQP